MQPDWIEPTIEEQTWWYGRMDIDNLIADVSRVVVINYSGQEEHIPEGTVLDMGNIQVDLALQDEGRTLKVFITEGNEKNGD